MKIVQGDLDAQLVNIKVNRTATDISTGWLNLAMYLVTWRLMITRKLQLTIGVVLKPLITQTKVRSLVGQFRIPSLSTTIPKC